MFIDRLNIVKVSFFPNLIHRISASYFVGVSKLILKFISKGKRPKLANSILKEKNKFRELTTLL